MNVLKSTLGIGLLCISTAAFPGVIHTPPVTLGSIAVLGSAFGGHVAPGNMEIYVPAGIQLSGAVNCDIHYVTTLKTIDPDRSMLSLLRDAKNASQQVRLWISDDPVYTAYPGRCSLLSVERL
ncbi:hypothetical protein G3N57_23030 [Paraburkholderia sp. Se-20369]|nr:hypothetical protein [Paraburkholderia sp. Se-20369]TCW84152.1 hypothetical protein C5O80_13865 [Burkholderia sp. SRS-46]